jgi:uncharacterized protein
VEFDSSFSVDAPIDDVWRAILDLERVAPCVPGARVTERIGDVYKVEIRMKLGPMHQHYKADIELGERDDAAYRAVMSATAREARGQGSARATAEMRLTRDGELTRGAIHTDMTLSGPAAAMGRGIVADVAARITEQFATNLSGLLDGHTEAPPDRVAHAPSADAVLGESPSPAASPPAADTLGQDAALPILPVIRSVLASRLANPRVAGTAVLIALIVGFLLGRLL